MAINFFDFGNFAKGYRQGELEDQADQRFGQEIQQRDLQIQRQGEELDFLRQTNPVKLQNLYNDLDLGTARAKYGVGDYARRGELDLLAQPGKVASANALSAIQQNTAANLIPNAARIGATKADLYQQNLDNALFAAQSTGDIAPLQAEYQFNQLTEAIRQQPELFRYNAARLVNGIADENRRAEAGQLLQQTLALGQILGDPSELARRAADAGMDPVVYARQVDQQYQLATARFLLATGRGGDVLRSGILSPGTQQYRLDVAGRRPQGAPAGQPAVNPLTTSRAAPVAPSAQLAQARDQESARRTTQDRQLVEAQVTQELGPAPAISVEAEPALVEANRKVMRNWSAQDLRDTIADERKPLNERTAAQQELYARLANERRRVLEADLFSQQQAAARPNAYRSTPIVDPNPFLTSPP